DRASAERWAAEEPYSLAGLYQEVTIVRADVLLHRGPAEGPLASGAPHMLITGGWPPEPRNASGTGRPPLGVDTDGRVSFVAVLVDDDRSCTTGIVSVVRALPAEALRITQAFAGQLTGGPLALTAQRWRRGGRSSTGTLRGTATGGPSPASLGTPRPHPAAPPPRPPLPPPSWPR